LLSFDAILNFSGGGVQSNSVETNIDIYRINLFFPIEVIGFLAENNFRGKFFSFGSYFEIGFNDEVKYFTEKEICKSDGIVPNIYCDSKRLLTKHFSNSIHNLKWFHLILPNIYGHGENDNRLIPYLISSLKKGQPLRLSSGEQVRQYLHVKDLCRLIFELTERDVKADIYTIPSFEQNIQIKDLINNIFKFFSKKENDWEVVQTRDQGMSVLLLDGTKIKNILPSWRPEISLNQGISEYI
jgi:nucleoside-diphosphate-sugar epimerase